MVIAICAAGTSLHCIRAFTLSYHPPGHTVSPVPPSPGAWSSVGVLHGSYSVLCLLAVFALQNKDTELLSPLDLGAREIRQ
jgi:hypothetical protein